MNLEVQMKQLSEQMETMNSIVIEGIDKNTIQFFCSDPKVLALLSDIGEQPGDIIRYPDHNAIVIALPQEYLFELRIMPGYKPEQQAECALNIESVIDAAACDLPELYRCNN